jgi:hypothetical protein
MAMAVGRFGLVELIENQKVNGHRLHPNCALHAAQIEIGVADSFETGGVGFGTPCAWTASPC